MRRDVFSTGFLLVYFGMTQTFFAKTEKFYPMTFYFKCAHPLGLSVDILPVRHFQILDLPAPLAYQMIMGFGPPVEAVERASERQFLYLFLLDEKVQIPIDGSQTQARDFPFELFINPIGGRMDIRFPKYFQYSVALTAVAMIHFFY
jgi:hypothetical protein